MKIKYSNYNGQTRSSDLNTIISDELSKSLASGSVEALESEVTNIREFLGTLTNMLADKKILSEDDIKELLKPTTIDVISLY